MRILIYLLAMLTGFSAAEAARPVASAPAAVTQGTVVVALVASVEREAAATPLEFDPFSVALTSPIVEVAFTVALSSPVSRNDLTRK